MTEDIIPQSSSPVNRVPRRSLGDNINCANESFVDHCMSTGVGAEVFMVALGCKQAYYCLANSEPGILDYIDFINRIMFRHEDDELMVHFQSIFSNGLFVYLQSNAETKAVQTYLTTGEKLGLALGYESGDDQGYDNPRVLRSAFCKVVSLRSKTWRIDDHYCPFLPGTPQHEERKQLLHQNTERWRQILKHWSIDIQWYAVVCETRTSGATGRFNKLSGQTN